MEDIVGSAVDAAVATIEGSEASGAEPVNEPVVEAAAEATTEQPAAEKETDNDEAELTALERELLTKTPTLGKGRISVSRHQAVLTRQRKQAEAAQAEIAAKYEKVKSYETWDQHKVRAFEIAEREPARYLEILRSIPEYRPLLDKMIADAVAEAKKTPAVPAVEDKEPEGNVLLDDGSSGFNAERAKQLADYQTNKAVAALRKEYDAKLEELQTGVKPILEQHKTVEALQTSFKTQGQKLTTARAEWPLFTEYEGKIREELGKPGNERLGLEDAYRRVVVLGERTNRETLRAEERAAVIKEMNDKAKGSSSARRGLPEAVADDDGGDPRDTESIVRRAASSLR